MILKMTKPIILIVDDDTDLAENLAFMIKTMGFDVVIAQDGFDGVSKYKNFHPEITLMDIKMPKLDGYEAFFKIKQFDEKAKVVFMSAYQYDEKRFLKAKSMFLLDILTKPFHLKEIKLILDKNFPQIQN
jgi:two-component system, chemotaxis family, chemotaxis protein CheY